MNRINTSKQRKEIWFFHEEPQNLYDLWLHQDDDRNYILQVWENSKWNTIGGSGKGCDCPQWIKQYDEQPSWWYNAERYDWHNANQVSMNVNGNNYVLYGPNQGSITIDTTQQQTTNDLRWIGDQQGVLLGFLNSNVNGVQDQVELRYTPDTEITFEDDHSVMPSSKAVYDFVNVVKTDLQGQIDDKQDIIQGGTNGQILSWNNGLVWVDQKWFRYQSVDNSKNVFFRISMTSTSSIINIKDGYLYDLTAPIESVDIQNISHPEETFVAGTYIKLTAGADSVLNIGENYNVVNLPGLSKTGRQYTLVEDTIYYLNVKMDSVVIYAVSDYATPVDPEQPDIPLDFDFMYFYGGPAYDWNGMKQLIDTVVSNDPHLDDTTYFPILSKYKSAATVIDTSAIDANKIYHTDTYGHYLYLLLKQGSDIEILIEDALGINDYKSLFTRKQQSYTYDNKVYELYRMNIFSDTKIALKNKQ